MTLLQFNIKDQLYCLDVNLIEEIIPLVKIIDIPKSPEYIPGIINYRGKVVTIVDLCALLGNYKANIFYSTRILIVNTHDYTCGLLVEKATEIIECNPKDLQNPGPNNAVVPFIDKILFKNNDVYKILNLDFLSIKVSKEIKLLTEEQQND